MAVRLRAVLVTVALATLVAAPGCRFLHRGERSAPAAPAPIDLNRASLRKVEALPGITPSMGRRIVDGRPYQDPHELVERGILTERELSRILDRVVVKDAGR
jgi:DNA uptake protein ComE-like DNA-binding protein